MIKHLIIAILLLTICCTNLVADTDEQPKISIIIDDLGANLQMGLKVVNLPGPVVCSILPYRRFTNELMQHAKQLQKEIMLHIPMQAISKHSLGMGGLSVKMDKDTFLAIFKEELSRYPSIRGINNHMGSLLTQDKQRMQWLMEELTKHNLFFIDSMTDRRSVAGKTAKEYNIATQRRHIFLDNEPNYQAIDNQFQELLRIAKQYGQAIAIGHPYPSTLAYLQKAIPELVNEGVELVPVSRLLQSTN